MGAESINGKETAKFRYFISSGANSDGFKIEFLAGTWSDVNGKPVSLEQVSESLSLDEAVSAVKNGDNVDVKKGPYFDVTYAPVTGTKIDSSTIDGNEFFLSGAQSQNLVQNGIYYLGDNTYRYLYEGQLDTGVMEMNFIKGGWKDTAGNESVASTSAIKLVTNSESFFIEISGGMMLNSAGFGDEPIVELSSQIIMEFDKDRKVFSLDFNGELKLYKLGSVGASAGRFVIDNSNTLSEVPQIWGVATIETNFSFLEQFGLFMFAKGTFQLNLTEHQKIGTLTLRGLDGGADVTRTFTLEAYTFAIEMLGEARVRPPGSGTDLVKLNGAFYLNISPEGFEMFGNGTLSYGVGSAQLEYNVTGLLVIQTGFGDDTKTPGIAGAFRASSEKGIGLPNVGSLFKASGTVTVMFNTTMQDVVFEIPDSFLAVLDGDELPGFTKAESDQPATFTIFSGAPSMKGERDPNAEAEVYITAIIKAELTIADTFTMMGYLKITAAADADGARLEVIGAVTTEITPGALTGSLNFNVFVGEKTGVVGRVALSLVSTNIPSVELGGILVLELNTFGSTLTVETFKTIKQTIGGREFFGGFVKNNNGEYETENVAIEVTGGFRLLLAGIITIADQFEISGAVEFKISATGSNASIELIVNGNLELAGIGRMTLIDSGFRVDSAGLVARFQVELDANFGKVLGLKFNASATFALNTTSGDKVFGQSTVKRGFMMEFNGEVEFLGFAKADGNVKLFIGPSESSFEFDVTFNIAEVLQFSAKGGARAVQGQGMLFCKCWYLTR